MAKKITELTVTTSHADTDVLPIVSDPGGSPVTKKITVADLFEGYGPFASMRAGVVNVLDKGADRTGATATHTKIQDAIDEVEAASGGVVELPAGTYKLTTGLTLPDMDSVNNREHPTFRGAGLGETILQIVTPTNITLLTMNGTWRIEGITFQGYESGANTPVGTGVNVVKCKDTGGIFGCHFQQLQYGVYVADLVSPATTPYMYASLVHGCWFEAMGTAGVWLGDVAGNATTVSDSHFSNGYPAGAGQGLGVYSGYNSNVKINGCSFSTMKTGVKLVGSQAPIVRDCYFENSLNAHLITDDTGAGYSPANYQVRNLLVEGCAISFNSTSQVFAYLRNCLNPTFICNWTTSQGDGFVDADTTVKGLVAINNRQDNSSTPFWKDDTPINGALALMVDANTTTGIPYIYEPDYHYLTPNASGTPQWTLYNGANAILQAGTWASAPQGLDIGGGTYIQKHLYASAALDFGSISAASDAELSIAVSGAAVGDSCYASPSNQPEAGLVWCAYAYTNAVYVRLTNVTGSPIDPANRTWRVDVWKH